MGGIGWNQLVSDEDAGYGGAENSDDAPDPLVAIANAERRNRVARESSEDRRQRRNHNRSRQRHVATLLSDEDDIDMSAAPETGQAAPGGRVDADI